MSKKHSAKGKHKKQKGAAPRYDQPAETAPPRISWTRHLTPIKLGLGLGVVAVGAALIWGSLRQEAGNSTLPRDDGSTTLPSTVAPTTAKPVVVGLPPAPLGTKTPINNVDPVTGQPIKPTSPTTVYKGYVIAFCCTNSSGYKGDWARMSETEKDAFVRRYLE